MKLRVTKSDPEHRQRCSKELLMLSPDAAPDTACGSIALTDRRSLPIAQLKPPTADGVLPPRSRRRRERGPDQLRRWLEFVQVKAGAGSLRGISARALANLA